MFLESKHHRFEFLNFTFEPQDNYVVSDAKLNLFLRSEKWLCHNDSETCGKLAGKRVVDIEVRMLTTNKPLLANEVFNVTLPEGNGRYLKIDLRKTVLRWFQFPFTNRGIAVKVYLAGTKIPIQKIAVIDMDTNSREFVSSLISKFSIIS